MGRHKINFDVMTARFPAGIFNRIIRTRDDDETTMDFIRVAVERELARRDDEKSVFERKRA
jgi:hypothetical protein